MRRTSFVIFISILLGVSNFSFADDFSFSLLGYSSISPGPRDPNNHRIQNIQSNGVNIEFTYFKGSGSGFLYGLGYGWLDGEHFYPKSSATAYNYESEFKFPLIKFGY